MHWASQAHKVDVMLRILLASAATIVLTLHIPAQAAHRPAVSTGHAAHRLAVSTARAGHRLAVSPGSFGYGLVENGVASADNLRTTHIRSGLFAERLPPLDVDRVSTAEDDPPVNHTLPDSLQRFANADSRRTAGWTTTLGLLPLPDSKIEASLAL